MPATDSMAAVVARCSGEFRYVWITQGYADWIGRPPEKIAGQPVMDVIGSEAYETLRPYIEQVLSGRRVEYNAEVNLPGRGRRRIHAVHLPMYSDGTEVDGWISVTTDITERKRMEQDRIPTRAGSQSSTTENELHRKGVDTERVVRALSMGEVATSIAHEVNQPLAGIAANAEASLRWLTSEPPNVQKARESLALIVRDANRATAIIRSIREFLKKERREREALDMNEIIQEAVAPVRAEFLKRRIALRIDHGGVLPPVWGDRIQLEQVILNLVLNGGEAMAFIKGPKVLLVKSRQSPDDGVLVAVRDCGAGVPPDDVQRIFEPLFTTKDAGMGLGLSISRSIIESHGGRIWATLNEGPGLTVQFSVPVAPICEPTAFSHQSSDSDGGIDSLRSEKRTGPHGIAFS